MMRGKSANCSKAFATLHTNNAVANDRWKATSAQARLGYMTTQPPNTKSDQPTLGYEERLSIKPLDEESNLLKNFSVVACTVYELEFLYLDFSRQPKANFIMKTGFRK
jgi:hypothetical protein